LTAYEETNLALVERNSHLPKQFEKAKLSQKFRSRPFAGRDLMTLNIWRNEFYVWPGQAVLQAYPDRKHRQVVLHADEEKREITRTVTIEHGQTEGQDTPSRPRTSMFRAHFPLGLTMAGVQYKVGTIDHTVGKYPVRAGSYWAGATRHRFTADVTAYVPKSEQTFLMGYDEHATFIAALPERVDTVSDAHEILRPNSVKPGSFRQGEWFFTEISNSLQAKVEQTFVNVMNREPWHSHQPRALDFDDSSHRAICVQHNHRTYARGYVTDARGATHHAPLFLPTWHLVTRNRELVDTAMPAMARRYWD
jgi:hypothetical protein